VPHCHQPAKLLAHRSAGGSRGQTNKQYQHLCLALAIRGAHAPRAHMTAVSTVGADLRSNSAVLVFLAAISVCYQPV